MDTPEEKHYMNPAYGKAMKRAEDEDGGREGGKPHIVIHSHSAGHTVHVMHPDGRHEMYEHEKGDAKGIAAHIQRHLGKAIVD